jgi:hypothetical protein
MGWEAGHAPSPLPQGQTVDRTEENSFKRFGAKRQKYKGMRARPGTRRARCCRATVDRTEENSLAVWSEATEIQRRPPSLSMDGGYPGRAGQKGPPAAPEDRENGLEKSLHIGKKPSIINGFCEQLGSPKCSPGPVISFEIETKRSSQESKLSKFIKCKHFST